MDGTLLLAAILEAKLTPRQREAFIDFAYVGRPHRDIAQSMGCTHTGVAYLVKRAREKLAQTDVIHELRQAA